MSIDALDHDTSSEGKKEWPKAVQGPSGSDPTQKVPRSDKSFWSPGGKIRKPDGV